MGQLPTWQNLQKVRRSEEKNPQRIDQNARNPADAAVGNQVVYSGEGMHFALSTFYASDEDL